MMENGNQKKFECIRKKEVPQFYNALFFSKDINGLSPKALRFFLSGKIARFINGVGASISYSSTRLYGCTFLSFGLLSLIINLLTFYFTPAEARNMDISALIIASVFALLAIPFMLVDKPMCRALQEFAPTDLLFFEFLSIKRMTKNESVKVPRPFVGIFFGVAFAVLTFFLPIEAVVFGVFAVVFTVISFVSPELPFIALLISVPYISGTSYSAELIAALSLLSFLAFMRKVLFGKKTYVFGISDIIVIAFIVIIITMGMISGGRESTYLSIRYSLITLSYFPAANIIVNRRLANRAINAVIVSSVPIAFGAVISYIVRFMGGVPTPSSVTMLSPAYLAVYLSIVAMFSIFYLIDSQASYKRPIGVLLTVLLILALITTECVPVLILMLLLVPGIIIIKNTRVPEDLLTVIGILPLGIFFLPQSVLEWVTSVIRLTPSFADLKAGIVESLNVMWQNIFVGIGADDVAHGNAFLGIGARFGIFALVSIAIFVLVRFRQVRVYTRFVKNSSLSELSYLTTAAMLVVLVMGCFFDLMEDNSLFCLIVTVFGMSTAALRVSKKDYDERVGYFEDQNGKDSSVADIILSK